MVAGAPVAGPGINEPLTAKQALGEFTTVDYCSLINASALPKELGDISDNGAPTFDYCFFVIRMKGAHIEGQVGYLEDKDSMAGIDRTEDRQRKPPRGMKVQRGEESDAMCMRFLQFADDVWLTISADASQDADAPKGDWCPLADAMVDMVIDRVGAQPVRHFTFDQKSVGALDACDLVKADVVAAKLGSRTADEQRYPSGHECEWGGVNSNGPGARLTFELRPTEGDDVKEETVAGRPTRILAIPAESADAFSLCTLETEHIKSTVFLSNELVDLQVALPGKGKDACGPARELAKEVWANLPKP